MKSEKTEVPVSDAWSETVRRPHYILPESALDAACSPLPDTVWYEPLSIWSGTSLLKTGVTVSDMYLVRDRFDYICMYRGVISSVFLGLPN